MNLSIVLPTFNEKGNIGILVDELVKIIPSNIKKEIIIIDDNSDDGTFLYCKELFKKNSEVRLILRKSKRSLGASVGEGIKNCSGEKIIVMDTDLNHNPIHIPELLKLSTSYDVVSCSRYCFGGSMKNKPRFFASYLYNVLLRIILNTDVKDNTGGYFCIKKEALDQLTFNKIFFGYGEYFFRLLYFLKIKNFKIKEIPTKYKERIYGQSKSRFPYMIVNYFISAVKLRLGI